MTRKLQVVFALLLLVSLVSACGVGQATPPAPTKAPVQETKPTTAPAPTKAPEPAQPPTPTPTPKPVTVKYGSFGGIIDESGVYVAYEKGYFKEQGITMDITVIRTAPELVAPLASDQLDVAVTILSPALLNAADRAVDLKIGAGVGQVSSGWDGSWIVLRKDLADSGKIKTAADLKGMKVAVPSLGSSGDLGMRLFLEQGGSKPGDVEVVAVPSAEQAAAFQNKAIAASFNTAVNIVSGTQLGLFVKWVPASQVFGGRLQQTAMIFSPAFTKDQDRGRRWMIGYLKGVRDYIKAFTTKEGRQQVVDILVKDTSVKDPKLYDLMDLVYVDPNGGLDVKSLDAQYKYWADSGLYTGKKRFQDMVDLSHADYAVQKLGKQ